MKCVRVVDYRRVVCCAMVVVVAVIDVVVVGSCCNVMLPVRSVVGEKEHQNGTVNIRTRDNKVHGEHSVAHVIERFNHFTDVKILDAEEKF